LIKRKDLLEWEGNIEGPNVKGNELPLSCPSILVVDDDQDLVNLLERILKQESYQVTKAYDGNSALALLEKGYRPDLIVLDIIMPSVDGFEVLDFVRYRYDIPVIMLTAKRDLTTLSDALAGGADDYINLSVGLNFWLGSRQS